MLAKEIAQSVKEKYEAAVKSGSLVFTETTQEKVKDSKSGIEYLVSYAPSLKGKPTKEGNGASDPFENPEAELLISEDVNGDDQFKLLLNKYPIVENHTILATKTFQKQNLALSPKELFTSYKYLSKLDDSTNDEVKYMMFYNCGDLSGSSVDHKHLQFIPLPKNFNTIQDNLVSGKTHFLPTVREEPLQHEKTSFAHFAIPLPDNSDDVDEDLLAMAYFSLLQRALTFFQDWLNERPEFTGKTSYNVMMTKKWLSVVPRSSPVSKTLGLNLNATAYVGLLLIKDEETLNKVKENASLIDEALLECGFPNTAGEKTNEYNY
ncbi:hypothetical protein TPHA_0E03900 [Tetrapisispora phaffii CBS 4417]|uniref:Uncharacterized protein n=1 Tax=Tetrapisispora phaffii (strain ATCC 24235 / CBS 4417 / NBRC 1672 / NRRL Y-8282 / UCD 70-5) TaxID=1071381 RepID=G8BUA1_TETPH|nr:hypothetical protein TPHA_0E03900 [Tetrapisispora phaffii CBS 4417]CCE63479.1 hypothetical protein TPHA_0E03900 [Tetrapisispora phaffii CBS 4417]